MQDAYGRTLVDHGDGTYTVADSDGALTVRAASPQAAVALIGAPPPAPPQYQTTGLSFPQFLALLTPAEQAALAISTDPQVALFVLLATNAQAIDLDNPDVVAGVHYCAGLGLIAAGRVAQILGGAPPA